MVTHPDARGLVVFLGLSGASLNGFGVGSRGKGAMTTVLRCDSLMNFSDTFRPKNKHPC